MPRRTRVIRAALAATYLLTVVASGAFHTHGWQPWAATDLPAAACHGSYCCEPSADCLADGAGQPDGPGLRGDHTHCGGSGVCAVCRFLAQHRISLPPVAETTPPRPNVERLPVASQRPHVQIVLIWHSRAPPATA